MYVKNTQSYEPPVEALTSQQYRAIEGGIVIDAAKVSVIDGEKRLKKFDVVGEITDSGKGRLVGYTKVAAAGSSTTEIEVKDTKEENLRGFVEGDTITVGSDTGLTIDSIDYDNQVITVDSEISPSQDEEIKLEDGAETAKYVLLSGVDLEQGDQVIGAMDECRLNEARMPLNIYEQIKTDLKPLIQFE